jgi:xanthine dehydrogenase D subunit
MATDTRTVDRTTKAPGVGVSASRPDGVPKVMGKFAFSSDLWDENMLWGATLRSPHASARIIGIDIAAALAVPGVAAVLTADDVPGAGLFGLDEPDQPVLASDVVRYMGEPVALVAADHPDTARRAADLIVVEYQTMEPLVDAALAPDAPPMHPDGNVVRHLVIRHGDIDAVGEVQVEGTYEVGMQDQAFLGPESGLARPVEGGVELLVSTQFLHSDHQQVAACLGLDPERVQLVLSGVGGAFGGREDVSLHIHLCMLALHTGRPVKMVYSRSESFFGHVHRHPARMWYRHHADRDGRLVKVEVKLLFDGGAYRSSSAAVIANAACFAAGPYRVPNALIDGMVVRTNNPSCGAMRGFGAVQTCFAHEAQMDKLAAALGLDPIEVRLRNVLRTGDTLVTGQVLTGAAPVEEVLTSLAALPLPETPPTIDDPRELPGGTGRTTDHVDVRRGVGYALGFKNLCFSEGFDDYSTARVRVEAGVATVTCACAEVGQGFVTLAQQITREVLGVDEVVLAPADTRIGSAGSTSASRQTWMSGGAVHAAAQAVRDTLCARVAEANGLALGEVEFVDGHVRSRDGRIDLSITDLTSIDAVEEEVEFHHAPTMPLDENGQGDAHLSFSFSAHRAITDVDPELGLIRLVELATSQEVGRILNPLQLIGQLEGGAAQGVGLALMEEIVVDGGLVRNPSFTDYLIPTMADLPTLRIAAIIEEPEPGAPFGAKGVGESPTISSTPAVVAAVRAATGIAIDRVPMRPEDIALDAGTPR